MIRIYKIFTVIFVLFAAVTNSYAAEGSDSRIRTYIYGKNDIYRLITTYGYQSSIELDPDEVIETVSLGNSAAFKVNPSGSRIFIRPLQMQQITNMTVVTDRRTYQFELVSTDESADNLMYVARFYYPDAGMTSPAPVSPFVGSPMMFPPAAQQGMPQPSQIDVPRVSINDVPAPQMPPVNDISVPQNAPVAIKDYGNSASNSQIPVSLRYKYGSF